MTKWQLQIKWLRSRVPNATQSGKSCVLSKLLLYSLMAIGTKERLNRSESAHQPQLIMHWVRGVIQDCTKFILHPPHSHCSGTVQVVESVDLNTLGTATPAHDSKEERAGNHRLVEGLKEPITDTKWPQSLKFRHLTSVTILGTKIKKLGLDQWPLVEVQKLLV